MKSDTPITDVAWNQCCDDEERLYLMKHTAEDIERQLADAKAEIQRLTELSKTSGILAIMEQLEEAQRQLAEAKTEITRACLREQAAIDDYKAQKERADDALLALAEARKGWAPLPAPPDAPENSPRISNTSLARK